MTVCVHRSHLVTVPPGTMLADVLMSSPMFVGDDGQPLASRAGYELGFDPSEDPELAMVCVICVYGAAWCVSYFTSLVTGS